MFFPLSFRSIPPRDPPWLLGGFPSKKPSQCVSMQDMYVALWYILLGKKSEMVENASGRSMLRSSCYQKSF